MTKRLNPEELKVLSVNELNLFSSRPLQVSLESYRETFLEPSKTYDANTGSIYFQIPATNSEFLSPEIWCYIEFNVTNGDNTDMAADDAIAVKINAAHTIFKDVQVKAGDSILTQTSGMYHYLAYIHDTFLTSTDEKTLLDCTSKLYLPKVGGYDTISDDDYNAKVRQAMIAESKVVKTFFKLHTQLSNQDGLIPPLIPVEITLTHNVDANRILSKVELAKRNQKLHIKDIKLLCRFYSVNTRLYLDIMKNLQINPINYPLKRYYMMGFWKGSGTTQFQETLLLNNRLPRLVIMLMVDSSRYSGDYYRSNYEFSNAKIDEVSLLSENYSYPSLPYRPNFYDWTREFKEMTEAVRTLPNFQHVSNGVTYSEFVSGAGALFFDLSRGGKPLSDTGDISRVGNLYFNMKFTSQVLTPIAFVFFMIFDSNISVNNAMQVGTDYSLN